MQLRVLGLRLLQNGSVTIGVPPKGEEVLTAAGPYGAEGRRNGDRNDMER